MRKWDYRAAWRPDFLIANSTHTKEMIKKYYGRDATVVFPPVDTKRFAKNVNKNRHGFIIAGRQTPYKRVDLAVSACSKLNLPLTVIGNGPEHNKLVKLAGPTIKFITNASDEEVARYFAEAEAFIFPGLDDFGITPVEAMAAGTPVIAYQAGGALDYVNPGKTGEFFPKQIVESLVNVLKSFKANKYRPEIISTHASKYSTKTFNSKFTELIKSISSGR